MKLEKTSKSTNPFVTLDRIFAKAERISVAASALLVFGTLGYLSFHVFA